MAGEFVNIEYDEKKLRQIQRLLRDIPSAMPRVMSKAINRTATSARAEIARQIAAKVKIKITAIKKGITQKKATYSRWLATLNVYGKRIPLILFGARQLKRGISYQISKAESRKKITEPPRPFIVTLRSGHRGVFRRHRPTTKRLPIIELFGPSVGAVFEKAPVIARNVVASSHKKLEKNIDEQVRFILRRRKPA